MIIKKHYTVEWIIDFYYQHYSDFKRFESGEEEKMAQFISDLSCKEGISKIWKNTFEEISF